MLAAERLLQIQEAFGEYLTYYWLTALNELKIGWDNAAHHDSIETTPHHKHVKQQACVRSSNEHSLDAVMRVVLRSPWQEDDA